MKKQDLVYTGGRIVNDSKTGTSSNRSNPFVMLSQVEATESYGEAYGMHLIYSWNHYENEEIRYFQDYASYLYIMKEYSGDCHQTI